MGQKENLNRAIQRALHHWHNVVSDILDIRIFWWLNNYLLIHNLPKSMQTSTCKHPQQIISVTNTAWHGSFCTHAYPNLTFLTKL